MMNLETPTLKKFEKVDIKIIFIILLSLVIIAQTIHAFSDKSNNQKDLELKIEQLRAERKAHQQSCFEKDNTLSGSIIEARKELAGLKIIQKQELTQEEITLLNGNGTPASTTP